MRNLDGSKTTIVEHDIDRPPEECVREWLPEIGMTCGICGRHLDPSWRSFHAGPEVTVQITVESAVKLELGEEVSLLGIELPVAPVAYEAQKFCVVKKKGKQYCLQATYVPDDYGKKSDEAVQSFEEPMGKPSPDDTVPWLVREIKQLRVDINQLQTQVEVLERTEEEDY